MHSHRHERSLQLVRLEHARRALAQASSVKQIKSIRAQAESVRIQAQRTALGLEIQNFAAELKLQAERRGGQLLSQLRLRGGDRKSTSYEVPRLKDLGIDKNQSARWQLVATVPEPLFCDYVRSAHADGREISSAALIRLAKRLRDEPFDQLTVRSNEVETAGPTDSYLQDVAWPTIDDREHGVSQITDLVSETRNHHSLLKNLVESLCHRAAIPPTSADYRALQRYLTQIDLHLKQVIKDLQFLANGI